MAMALNCNSSETGNSKDGKYLSFKRGDLMILIHPLNEEQFLVYKSPNTGIAENKNIDIIYKNLENDKLLFSDEDVEDAINFQGSIAMQESVNPSNQLNRMSTSTAPAILDSQLSVQKERPRGFIKIDSTENNYHMYIPKSAPLQQINSEELPKSPQSPKKTQGFTLVKKGSIRKFRRKASDLFTSAKLSPGVALIPSSFENFHHLNKSSSLDYINRFKMNSQINLTETSDNTIQLDKYGFIIETTNTNSTKNKESNPNINEDDDLDTNQFEKTKINKWNHIIKNWSSKKARKSYRVKKLVQNGCPSDIRGEIWMFLSNAKSYKNKAIMENELNKPIISYYDEIEKDLTRTYPKHAMFTESGGPGQQSLMNVLRAYSQYNPKIGYCQGMGMLVGLMLMQGLNEEDSFLLLVATIDNYLQGYFTPTLAQLQIHAKVFEVLLKKSEPKIHSYFQKEEATPLLYVTRWFLTVFTITLPWASVLRVWDLFYYKGVKILFKVGLAVMKCIKDYILYSRPPNFEILSFLMNIPPDLVEPEKLMKAYKRVDLKTKDITKLCAQAEKQKI